jgi:hypothetical protein
VPDPTSTDYRTITEQKVYGQFYFNAKERSCLREVTISGVKLVWDYNSEPALKQLSDKNDLKRIMIVADSVHIKIPLRFPQSEVLIFARQLVFSARGSIDITPQAKTDRPPKKRVSVGGKLRGIDGIDGSDAGTIVLSVGTLCLPDQGNKPTVRIIARGADGQPGGDGGLVDESLGRKQPPPRVTWKMFSNPFFNTPFAAIPFGIPLISFGMTNALAKFTNWKSKQLAFPAYITKHFETHHVLHLDVKVNMPGGLYLRKWGFTRGKKEKPPNGSDAYPSGKPGKGGKGGTVVFLGKLAFVSRARSDDVLSVSESDKPCKIPFSTLVDLAGGAAGTSKPMKGQQPALRTPASFIKMMIRLDGSGPWYDFTPQNASPSKGKDFAAPRASKGAKGSTPVLKKLPTPYIHEYNAEAMLSYAKDASMAYNRALAGRVVNRYLDALEKVRDKATPRLEALRAELDTLKQRLNTDVDIYDNQLGWVPHLSVVANRDLFEATAKNAFDSMYLCTKMKDRYETMADNLNCLSATRDECAQQMSNAQKNLAQAQDSYFDMQSQFDDINAQVGALQAEVVTLNNEIKQWAELDAKNKAIYAGIAETLGGAVQLIGAGIQMIPVGQPATGLIGGAVQVAGGTGGKLVSTIIEGGDFFDAAGQMTEQAAKFIDDNKESIANEVVKRNHKVLNQNLDEAQKKYKEIGKITQALAGEKDLLKEKLKADEVKLPKNISKKDFILFKWDRGMQDILGSEWDSPKSLQKKFDGHITELEALLDKDKYRETLKTLGQKRKKSAKLADQVADLSKMKQDKVKDVKNVLGGLANMKGGIQQGLGGIRKMCMSKEDLAPKIQAQVAKLKGTVYADRFEDLSKKVALLNTEKEEFVRRFERCQMTIDGAMSRINNSMAHMDVIDDRTLGISGALDHSVYSTLVSLDSEARAMLVEQLYYFAKSYEYRFLQKVDSEFYKLDKFIKKLEKFLKVDASGTKVTLTKDEFQDIYGLLTARLRKFVKPLIQDLQKRGPLRRARWTIPARQLVDENTFQGINTHDSSGNYQPLVFNFVKCGFGESTTEKLRIVNLDLKEVEMADPQEAKRSRPTFSMEFEHSGVSVLYDGKEQYMFRSQTDDEKISWKFTCNVDRDGNCKINPFEKETRDIELLKELCESEKDVDQLSAPYRPGALSDITLVRKKAGRKKERAQIADFVIEVELEGRF